MRYTAFPEDWPIDSLADPRDAFFPWKIWSLPPPPAKYTAFFLSFDLNTDIGFMHAFFFSQDGNRVP